MKKILFLLVGFVIIFSCKRLEKIDAKNNSPYVAFFKTLETEEISDTILVQSQTKIFGCGTAAYEYMEGLKKSGLDKFYEKYEDVLSDTISINKFEKTHNIKILWITRGNEGEKMELLDSVLHKNTSLEKRLWETKNFIKFTQTPIAMNAVDIYYSIAYPKEKKYFTKVYKVSKVNEKWESIKMSSHKSEVKDFQYAYYPF
ncbi:hypothetical protein [Flavobacterium sp.]|uniref:hypothetical protein n=1 Tax=Flavobacterium sp. TaxID=239 RepID=UPI00286D875D|nr:hypothetical protein [Flavobacterium sp.]